MNKKKADKIRRKRLRLDNDYYVAINGNGSEWEAYHICDLESYVILNSTDNTEKELDEFIKKNTRYDFFREFAKTILVVNILLLISIIINFKIGSSEIRSYVWGALSIIWIANIIGLICRKHNDSIDTQKLLFKLKKMSQENEEALKSLNEQLSGEENECKN